MFNALLGGTYFEDLCESCKDGQEEDGGIFSEESGTIALTPEKMGLASADYFKEDNTQIILYTLLSLFIFSSMITMIYMMYDSLCKKGRLRNVNKEIILEEGNIELLSLDQGTSFKRTP